MTDAEKVEIIKSILDDGTGYLPDDSKLVYYVNLSGIEILNWKYHLVGGVPEDVTEVPAAEEIKQIYAVITGYTQAGAEGEQTHIENGVHRHFRYSDMLDYIHNHVLPYARVGALT